MNIRKMKNISRQIEQRQNDIKNLESKIIFFEDEKIEKFEVNLSSLVKESKQKYLFERNQIFTTFGENVTLFRNETEKRFLKMKQEFEIEKKLILANSKKKSEISDTFIHNLNRKLKSILFDIKNKENKFLGVKITAEKSIAKNKQKIGEEIKKMKKLSIQYQNEKKKCQKELKETSFDDLNELEKVLSEKKKNYFVEESEKQKDLIEYRQNFKNKRQIIELNQLGRLSNIDSIVNDLKKHQTDEIMKLKTKNSQVEKKILENIRSKQKEIDELKNQQDSERLTFLKKLDIQQQNHKNEIVSIRQQFRDNHQKIQLEFEICKTNLQRKNEKLFNDVSFLEKQKESLISNFNHFYSHIEEEENQEIENLRNNFKLTFSDLQNSLSNNLTQFSQKCQRCINEVKEKCFKKKLETLKNYEFECNQEMMKAKLTINNSSSKSNKTHEKAKEDLILLYARKYNEFQTELLKIEPPKLKTNKYLSLQNTDLDNLMNEFNERKNKVHKERKKLKSIYSQQIEDEERRHSQKLKEFQTKELLIEKIHIIRKEKEIEMEFLSNIHKNALEGFGKVQKEFEKKLDLIELHFMNQKTAKMNEIDLIRHSIDDEKEKIRNMIFELHKKFDTEAKPLRAKLNILAQNKLKSYNFEKTNDEELIKMMRYHKASMKQLREKIHDVKTAQQLIKSEHEHRLYINQQKNHKSFERNCIKFRNEIESLKQNLVDSKKSLTQVFIQMKILSNPNLNYSLSSNPTNEMMVSSDNERIVKLTQRLEIVNHQLSSSVTEFQQIKYLLMAQERRFNTPFGQGQSVAVLHFTPQRYME